MSSVHALEKALGVAVHPMVRLLRRLFYCAEWIESHALHIYLLNAPDFFGYPDALRMAAVQELRGTVERALRLKKIGNRLMSVLGGREIHPVSVAVGGFYRVPSQAELRACAEDLKWALDAALETVRLTGALPFPDFEDDYEFVALSHPGEYAMNEGRLVSNRGLNIDVEEYEDHFLEQHVKHSTSLHSVIRERGSYLVGPLARFNLNYQQLPETAREAARECGLAAPCLNPFKRIAVRSVELVFACAEALRLIGEYEPPPRPRVAVKPRAGRGEAVTEAPRGSLYHRYALDDKGLVLSAKIVPPTSQNLKRMEDDLWRYVPRIAAEPVEEITRRCEMAVRNYDPCISCSVHALRASVDRE
jgi:coenzyme F420-reducing hydrogenase alpha subunit